MNVSNSCGSTASPPRVPLTLRIGIVGHRPNRLTSADPGVLAIRISELIRTAQTALTDYAHSRPSLFNDSPPLLRAVSPLAEGTDRLFADVALDAGSELCAVLPFPQTEFENDFLPPHALESASVERFRALLSRATTVYQLDGQRTDAPRAYHVAGTVVLNQSDLLIVVWDGERRHLRGGTEETFDQAVQRGVPVVWVDAHAPHHWQMVTRPLHTHTSTRPDQRLEVTHSSSLRDLQQQVQELIALAEPPGRTAPPERGHAGIPAAAPETTIGTFYSETQDCCHLSFAWKAFRDAVADCRLHFPDWRVTPIEGAIPVDWVDEQRTAAGRLLTRLRPWFVWPDRLAARYANRYRSAFITAFAAAALAVFFALAPLGLGLAEHSLGEAACTIGELLCIVIILLLVFRGRRGLWHQRWLDYRLLAEFIRHQRLVVALGGERASPRVPEHLTGYGDVGATWMAWYARAVERSVGVPSTVVDRPFLQSCVDDLLCLLSEPEGQIGFHQRTHGQCTRIEHRLHRMEILLFALTFICCTQHLMQSFPLAWFHVPGHILTFFCGVLPATGAALAGINNQGEFRRISQRSRAMAARLNLQREKARNLRQQLMEPSGDNRQLSVEVAELASETGQIMVAEVLDWKIIFSDRPLQTT